MPKKKFKSVVWDKKVGFFASYVLRPREFDTDRHEAIVIYTTNSFAGPWHEIATCHADDAQDIADALNVFHEIRD